MPVWGQCMQLFNVWAESLFNRIALRKSKIVHDFFLSECNRVKILKGAPSDMYNVIISAYNS